MDEGPARWLKDGMREAGMRPRVDPGSPDSWNRCGARGVAWSDGDAGLVGESDESSRVSGESLKADEVRRRAARWARYAGVPGFGRRGVASSSRPKSSGEDPAREESAEE